MSTLIGIILGITLLVGSILMGGSHQIFINLGALMIVFGGTIAATLVSFRLPAVLNIFRVSIRLFRRGARTDIKPTVTRLIEIAHKASQTSIYELEKDANEEQNPYIAMGLWQLVKDVPGQRIARRYAIEVDGIKARHQRGIRMFSVMGKVAPSFGLVGTLIGLISMLNGISAEISPETLGPNMAVALVTTLYGALLAFLLFIPASEKLKDASAEEIAHVSMIRDGILMIKDGYTAREIEQMLNAYLAKRKRESIVDQLVMQDGKTSATRKK